MPDINIDFDFFEHRKTKRTVGLLGRGSDILPIRLWGYCGKYHSEDGKLIGYSGQEIESACDWWGEKGKMVEAFLAIVWLEKIDGGYQVHDWLEHQGHLFTYKKRASEAAKTRWSKLRAATSIPTSNAHAPPSNATNSIVESSPVSSKGGSPEGRDFAVDPPPGFPKDQDEAWERSKTVVFQADGKPPRLVTRQFVTDVWQEAANAGWRDRQGNQIASHRWHGHVSLAWSRLKQFEDRNPGKSYGNGNYKTAQPNPRNAGIAGDPQERTNAIVRKLAQQKADQQSRNGLAAAQPSDDGHASDGASGC